MPDEGEVTISNPVAEQKRHSFIVDLLIRLVKTKPLGAVGGIIVIVLLVVGIFANFIAPYGMNEIHLVDKLLPPSPQHLLGTDQLGRDLLSNIIWGARISVIVGLAAAACSTATELLVGMVSGYIGGKTDLIVQRVVDAWMAIPPLLILLVMMSLVGRGMVQVILVIGIPSGIRISRVLRSAVIGIKGNVYIDAGRAIGCSTPRMLIRHIMPNIIALVIINFSLSVGFAILMEASLSFLGFGVPPGIPSWGSMLSQEGRAYMQIAPQLALYPGLALSICVYGVNMFGDALRDLLDPRLRGGVGHYRGVKKKKRKQETVSKEADKTIGGEV